MTPTDGAVPAVSGTLPQGDWTPFSSRRPVGPTDRRTSVTYRAGCQPFQGSADHSVPIEVARREEDGQPSNQRAAPAPDLHGLRSTNRYVNTIRHGLRARCRTPENQIVWPMRSAARRVGCPVAPGLLHKLHKPTLINCTTEHVKSSVDAGGMLLPHFGDVPRPSTACTAAGSPTTPRVSATLETPRLFHVLIVVVTYDRMSPPSM